MYREKYILIGIILLAIFLRIIALDQFPPSLFADEVDAGYQAYSILKTGRDINANFMPASFESFSDFRTPLYIYSIVPLISIFGLNEWSVRLPAATFGILSVVGIYFLAKHLEFNSMVRISAAFLLAISPWHLHYSRAAFEATLMLAIILWALVFFFKGQKKRIYFFVSAALFPLSIYSYSTAKLFIPLLLLGLIIIYRSTFKKLTFKFNLFLVTIAIVISLPFISDLISGHAGYRFSYTSIFADPIVSKEVDFSRQVDGIENGNLTVGSTPSLISKLSHNKILSFSDTFVKNYLSPFSSTFLFLNGDYIGRHSVGKMGELYLVEVISIIFGLLWLTRTRLFQSRKILLLWLAIAPIPAALTVEGATHSTRLFILIAPLVLISSLGLDLFLKNFWTTTIKKVIFAGFVFLFCLNIYNYFHRYYIHYPKEQERLWHYGFKQAILKAEAESDKYEKIVFTPTTEPSLIFLLFWTKFDPKVFQDMDFDPNNPKLGKYSIESVEPPSIDNTAIASKTLAVTNQKDLGLDLRYKKIPGVKVIDIITYPSGDAAFYLITHE